MSLAYEKISHYRVSVNCVNGISVPRLNENITIKPPMLKEVCCERDIDGHLIEIKKNTVA